MAVTNNGAPGTITVGANITYTLTTTNLGPSPAKNIVVKDTIPAGMPVVSATINSTSLPCGLTPGPAGTTIVTCNIGDKAANAGDSMTVVATGNVVGTMSATATVTANGTDPNPANNTATAVNLVKAKSADVWIAIQPTTFAPPYNTSFGYTFTVHNNGPDPATGVTITDVLPASLAFVSSATGCAPVTPGSQTIQCAIGALGVGAGVAQSITVTAAAVGAILDTATVAAVEGDPVPANNSASALVNVPASADLSIVLTAVPNPVVVQNNFTYKMTTTNNGPSTATTVVSVLHLLPSTGQFQAVGALPNNCVGVGGTKPHINCTYASLGSGQSVSTLFTFKATGIGTVSTSATTSSAVADPNQANNTATHSEAIVKFVLKPILTVLQEEIRVGAVSARAGVPLTVTLDVANGLADLGDYAAARELLLNGFTNEVNRFMADGSVTQAAGATLLQDVNVALGIEVLR
jgi:uncharacterized repeat protein (TIGR01451 family)